MDEKYLATLSPAILTYCAIYFPVFFTLPRFRIWIRTQLDTEIARGPMPFLRYFSLDFYLRISQYLDIIAGIFLIGALVTLLSPLGTGFQFASLLIALGGTALLIVIFSIGACISAQRAMRAAIVTF